MALRVFQDALRTPQHFKMPSVPGRSPGINDRLTLPPLRWHAIRSVEGTGLKPAETCTELRQMADMHTRTSTELFTYWNTIRGAEAGPLRSTIEPGEIRHVLADMFILEAAEEDPVFRLAGTRVCSLFDRELRGLSFSALWPPGKRDEPVSIASGVMRYSVPTLLNLTGFVRDGRTLRMEMLLLPVRSSGRTYDRLLGSLSPDMPANEVCDKPLCSIRFERSRIIGLPAGSGVPGQIASGESHLVADDGDRASRQRSTIAALLKRAKVF